MGQIHVNHFCGRAVERVVAWGWGLFLPCSLHASWDGCEWATLVQLTSQVTGNREKSESTAHLLVFWLGILARHFDICVGGGGWRYPLHLLVCAFAGQLSSPLSAGCTFTVPNPLVPADPGCYFVECRLSQRETRAHSETLLLFPSFKMWTYLLALLYGKNPISRVRSLKRHRPLKLFLGVWAKTNNNFVRMYMTDSADTQIANCFGCLHSQMLCPFLVSFAFSVRPCEHFCSFKNKTQILFADRMSFFKSTHTHMHTYIA